MRGTTVNRQERERRDISYHNYLFVFGFIYYMIIPLIIVKNKMLTDYPAMHLLDDYNLPRFFNIYILSCFIIFISFLTGSWIGKHSFKYRRKTNGEPLLKASLINKFIVPIALVGLFVAYLNRGALFMGYLEGADSALTGSIATIMLSSVFWLVYELILYKKPSKIMLYTVIIFAVILLGLGSRMYVMIPTVACMVYLIEFKVVKLKKLLIWGVMIALFFTAMGLIRFGDAISMDGLMYIGFAEPCLTWISAESMFYYTKAPDLFSFPYNFLTSIFNYIPAFLLPNKAEYIKEIALPYDQPLGATNLIVSLVSNFGIIGGGIFMFYLGYGIEYVRKRKRSVFGTTFYICICGVLQFQFFRDNLSIVNKVVIMNLLIIPLILRFVAVKFLTHRIKQSGQHKNQLLNV